MTTANDLIKRAYKTAGILGEGETMTAEMASDGLVYLNDLLELLSLEKLMIYQTTEESHTMDGSASYTWGSGGDIATTRPLRITSAYFRVTGIDYPVSIIRDKNQWDGIYDKTDTSDLVDFIYLYNDYPLATLYVYPQPSAGDLYLTTWKQLSSLALGTTSISLPPGYEAMLRFNLAQHARREYQMPPDMELNQIAMESKASIKRVNSKPSLLKTDLPIANRSRANIERGY